MATRISIVIAHPALLRWVVILCAMLLVAASLQVSSIHAAAAQGLEVSASADDGCPGGNDPKACPGMHSGCTAGSTCHPSVVSPETSFQPVSLTSDARRLRLAARPHGASVAPPFHPPKPIVQV